METSLATEDASPDPGLNESEDQTMNCYASACLVVDTVAVRNFD